jgi:hypothetical protein
MTAFKENGPIPTIRAGSAICNGGRCVTYDDDAISVRALAFHRLTAKGSRSEMHITFNGRVGHAIRELGDIGLCPAHTDETPPEF